MRYEVKLTDAFERMLKPLAKQHPEIFPVLKELIGRLQLNPKEGVSIGKSCHKIRIPLGNKGKRGGARVITYVMVQQEEVFLLAIYSKNNLANLKDKELEDLLKNLK